MIALELSNVMNLLEMGTLEEALIRISAFEERTHHCLQQVANLSLLLVSS